jgi:hypothetical protein
MRDKVVEFFHMYGGKQESKSYEMTLKKSGRYQGGGRETAAITGHR